MGPLVEPQAGLALDKVTAAWPSLVLIDQKLVANETNSLAGRGISEGGRGRLRLTADSARPCFAI